MKSVFASTIAKNGGVGSGTAKKDGAAASSSLKVLNSSYPGGKRGAGVYQALINLIPPHTIYIETHLGAGAVMRNKLPAKKNIGIDADPDVCAAWDTYSGAEACTIINDDAARFLAEYTDKQHLELLQILKRLPCRVMISGYWSEMYDQQLTGWHTYSFSAQTRGGKRTEFVWMNYPAPIELHDYRYLGSEYRERERIKRKRKRWVSKLENMPHLERQALLSVINEVFSNRTDDSYKEI